MVKTVTAHRGAANTVEKLLNGNFKRYEKMICIMETPHIRERSGRSMAIRNTVIAIGLSLVMLTGCAGHTDTIPEAGALSPETGKTEESVNQNSVEGSEQNGPEAADETDRDVVTLVVFYRWNNGELDRVDEEYVLEDEHAEVISDLFYNHEKRIVDSPAAWIPTVKFQIGEDNLDSDNLRSLDGRINGEPVTMDLSNSEYETLYQIVLQYADDPYIAG